MTWPRTEGELRALQDELAARATEVEPWRLPADGPGAVGAVFFASSTAFPEGPGEPAWAAAVVVREGRTLSSAAVSGEAGASYRAGYLALREGPLLERAVRALEVPPDVLLVDASGRDHPRGAGLALHLGSVLDLPTVGVTDRPLLAEGPEPGTERGSSSPLVVDGEIVGFRVRTRKGARPVAAHAAWRTDPETARDVVVAATGRARTPEPLRLARYLARVERARDEGRLPPGWRQDAEPVSPRRK
ncbi:MAG: endonuclease V [Actinobacteria bacterium]|nr:endonuclease V [Actinomycetota bacterium]